MSLNLPTRQREKLRVDTSLAIVNIVLLLIFFFLVAGQAADVPADLSLAQTSTMPPEALPSPLLEVRSDSDWRLDGNPVQPDLIGAALSGSTGPVYLLIDREARADLLLGVISRPELAGWDLKLVTMKMGGAE